MSRSQNDEEEVVLRLFSGSAPQRFLDIGAHDGETFSNTRCLVDLGWGATLIEPSPAAFVGLMKNYEGKENITLVHAAVVAAGPQRLLKFYDSHGDMISTLDEKHREIWASYVKNYQPIYVAALSVADTLAQFPGPYAFVNLDVEGINYDVFRELPLRALGVQAACVEYQDRKTEITNLAKAQGYSVVHTTTENLILKIQ